MDFDYFCIMRLYIRNMVCRHCVEALGAILADAGVAVHDIGLGYAVVDDASINPDMWPRIDAALADAGFERISDGESRLVQEIKYAVIDHVRSEEECRLKLSACIEKHLGQPYDNLSRVFSAREGRSIEKYAIAMRVEWVKELLAYRTYTVSEIAFRTGYSSAAHLSRQFKAVTGLTPTQFLQAGAPRGSLADV